MSFYASIPQPRGTTDELQRGYPGQLDCSLVDASAKQHTWYFPRPSEFELVQQ